MTTTQHMLDERYGRRPSRSRRVTAIVAGILFAVVVAAFAWSVAGDAAESIDADATAFEVIDEHRVSLTFQVSAPLGSGIACALEAQDEEHGVVGWRVVEYPPSDDALRAFTESLPTVSEATTGLVNACWVT
jgi:hypothetical protein